MNELHRALHRGDYGRACELIQSGTIDINERDELGCAPFIYSAMRGYSPLVDALLARGADITPVNETGLTALHACSVKGHVFVALALLRAGSDVEATDSSMGTTPLHLAAQEGNAAVVQVLVEAGARVDRQAAAGQTALYLAAIRGQAGVVGFLLRAKANPLLACNGVTPLEAAVRLEYPEVVRTMLEVVGLDVCGGPTRGANAAHLQNHVILTILTEGGAVDRYGQALCAAVASGNGEGVAFLLRKKSGVSGLRRYANSAWNRGGIYPIQCCFLMTSLRLFSCRIVRMLLDAGAEVDRLYLANNVVNDAAGFAAAFIQRAVNVPDDQVRGLEGMRRLLLQVDAFRSVSWAWPRVPPRRNGAASQVKPDTPHPLASMRPVPRQRARLLRPLFRYTEKLDRAFLGYGSQGEGLGKGIPVRKT